MIIEPKIRGFICTTSHPAGCQQSVLSQIDVVKSAPSIAAPKRVLVIGASTGYGLASRIALAFGGNAETIGVFFEKPAQGKRTASAGWYNTAAFEQASESAGLYAKSLNGDAFSDELKQATAELIKADWGQVDCVVYSLASPRRTHPDTGEVVSSVLKPIGAEYSNKTVDTNTGEVKSVSIEPAAANEIDDTVTVMGGDDWSRWIAYLQDQGLLANQFTTLAYSYIGPELTYPIYTNGTIGQAKQDLQQTAEALQARLAPVDGRALIAVNKAVVTQSSSAIPVVPLYISLLMKVMEERGTNEGCIEQMQRLFQHLFGGGELTVDESGRLRVDDWEMDEAVQARVSELWQTVSTENLAELGDLAGYQQAFLRLFGFAWDGIDYQNECDPQVDIGSIDS